MRLLFIFLMFLSLGLTACNSSESDPVDEIDDLSSEINDEGESDDEAAMLAADYRVLFIGNSLTSYNDLPELFEEVARDHDKDVYVRMVAKNNFAIVDHWMEGDVQKLIESKRYDFVVIQQGPSSQEDGRVMLIEDGKLYKDLCNENNAELAYFMVWPSRANYHTFDGVISNYAEAAEKNEAILCPVGQQWKTYFDQTGDFSYYGPDDFHPSERGSQVAAEIIYKSLFENECEGRC